MPNDLMQRAEDAILSSQRLQEELRTSRLMGRIEVHRAHDIIARLRADQRGPSDKHQPGVTE
jgi:hypothetical protein